jgi:two-component system CheB/CheR fusion protein
MQITGVTDLPAYLGLLRSRADEVQALLQDLLISVTNFFRDRAAWEAVEAIVPRLFAGKASGDHVRVWAPACATGEEAYTVAMLLMDYAATLDQAPQIQVFATDIDEDAIAQARQGIYPEATAGDITPQRLKQYFMLQQGRYHVRKDLREHILFAPHNLLRDPPFLKVDLITCRNLLIYLSREAQDQVLRAFHYSLCPDGVLLLGSSESVDSMPSLFAAVDKQARLFQRRNLPSAVAPPIAPPSRPTRRPTAPPAAPDQEVRSLSDLHRQLLAEHAPPSVIVNQDGEIVHLSRGIWRFLQFDAGEPSHNLLHVIHPDLRLELRAALFTARREQTSAAARHVRVTLHDAVRLVDLLVEPIGTPEWAQGYSLVLVNDVGAAAESGQEVAPDADDVVRQVEADLERTRAQLRGMVEQYETAVEEQKSANEELQAMNEELRAATEELETSKEELQSVNEELTTLNLELHHKVDEVSQAHNDLQNLIASTEIGTMFLDRQLRIKRYTPSVEGLFNLLPTDLNRPLGHVTHTLAYDQLAADAAQVIETRQGVSREVASARGHWYLVQMLPYRTDDDHIQGVVVTFVDITERKRVEAEREQLLLEAEQARREAEAALLVRAQFLSIASHELRTPLTPLLGYAQLLQRRLADDTPLDPQQIQPQLTAIVRQSRRLNTLVEQLLDVSRLQRGQFTQERQPVDLGALVAQSVEEFRQSLPAVEAQHAITLVPPEAPVLVFGDPARLDEVMHNLLSNAVKYSPAGGRVEVRVTQQAAEAVLEVRDQGIGIPMDAQARLFEPFYRAGNVSPQSSGFGIGLYIVQEIVARHGGRIEVQSMEHAGSRFRVVLPALVRDE